MEWHVIPTGRVWVDPGGPFGLVPRALWIKHQTPDELGRVPMNLNCLLVITEGKVVVVDTGLGDKLSPRARENWGLEHPEGTLLDNLAAHGVRPQDVELVIDTHLHADHCSGNTRFEGERVVPTFPKATYMVQRLEFADAMHTDARTQGTYYYENFGPVWEAGCLTLLHGDTQVTRDIRCSVTRGHTRGHQCVILEGDGAPIIFMADLASFAVHFARTSWVTAYDVEPLETIATKLRWQAWAMQNDARLVFQHDSTTRMGKLIQDNEGKLSVERV